MSEERMSREQRKALTQCMQAVIQQLAAGRPAEEVIRQLTATGWTRMDAEQFVKQLQEQWQAVEHLPEARAALFLQLRFPDMRPLDRSPSLFTVNGIGTTMYGNRDRDAETSTHVETQCFCVLFVPILALGAYRVQAAGDGTRYVFGRVPLSGLAKAYNLLIALSLLCLAVYGGWHVYTDSEDYRVGRTMARADRAAEAGQLVEAAQLYSDAARSTTNHQAEARRKLSRLIDAPQFDELPFTDAVGVLEQIVWTLRGGGCPPSVLERGLSLVRQHAANSPQEAVDLLALIALLSPEKAGDVFLELIDGPLAELRPQDAVAVFESAAEMPVKGQRRQAVAERGLLQSRRVADSDPAAAAGLLKAIAPLGDPAEVDSHLSWLLGEPLAKADCAVVGRVIEIARAVKGTGGQSVLIEQAVAWLNSHPQVDPRDALALLEQLAGWESAEADQIAAARRMQLERLVAAEPADTDAATQLALLLEADGETKRIEAILTPHREQLASGEGARMLGQVLAAKGDFDGAYALLGPYLDERLEAFHAAERAFESAITQVQESLFRRLSQGREPAFDYLGYESAGDDEKNRMVAEYLGPKLRDDRNVADARAKLAEHAAVVPAALDLGMVTLQRAQSLADPAARQAELERAEKTFLAVRGVVGDSDQYRLNLAQVYYWLGKHQEGRQLFDEMLSAHDRAYQIVLAVAHVLREVGAFAECRELLEEAYAKASNEEEKQAVAHVRAITCADQEEQISWLERCNTELPEIKALLASCRGRQASNQGNDEEAARYFRESVAIYDDQTKTTSSYNNGALACFALFEATGEREAFGRGVRWLEQAVALSPSDALVLGNAGSALMKAALQDLAGPKLNLRALHRQDDFSVLNHLATDAAALADLQRRAASHTGLTRARNYCNRALVLSPKSAAPYMTIFRVLGFIRDEDVLQSVLQKMRETQPDFQQFETQAIKYYRFEDDEEERAVQAIELARRDALVEQYRGQAQGPQFAVAVEGLINASQQSADASSIDVDRLVQLAEEAHRTAPTRGTYLPLIRALTFRAHRSLAEKHSEYAGATAATGRSLSPMYTVVIALSQSGELGESARSHPDVQRASDVVLDLLDAFPEARSYWSWALLRQTRGDRAEPLPEKLAQDEFDRLQRELTLEQFPMAASTACDEYWARLAAGDAEHAYEPFDRVAELGVPLPLEWIKAAGP